MKTDSIVVLGGGSAGWMTAATLIRAFPDKKITVIESENIPIIGVGESTLGQIRRWTHFIGLDEKSFFPHTNASIKMSIKFTDFYKKDSGSFHYPFGGPISIENRNPYQDWHRKKYFYPETKVTDFTECLFSASALYSNNKFSLNLDGKLDNFNLNTDYAYHFDAVQFSNWLRENYCLPKGVNHIVGTVKDIITNETGIEKLILENGKEITSDLFVDCTGFKSMLLGEALKEPFDSYSDMLPNNKAWATRVSYKNRSKELEGYTNCTARQNGWCWNIPLWSRLGTGYVYSDKFVSKKTALEEFKEYLMSDRMTIPRTKEEVDSFEYKEIDMRVGIHKRTFVKNVVAIGLSAGFIEPLESNGLFSVHEFLFKLLDILQRDTINQFDRDMYNVSVRDLFDGFAKFVVLHYALSHRDDSEYWRAIQNKSFVDARTNDPYTQHVTRTDIFYNMIWRYMNNWSHTTNDNAGITYISTGMNLFMANDQRLESYALHVKPVSELKLEIDEMNNFWNKKKAEWKKVADSSPTIEEYLKTTFYS